MIEISLTEILLLIWAVAASGLAMHYREEASKARFLLRAFVEDPKVRDQVVRSYEDFKARVK
jgi:hypothetical protein